MSLSHAVPVPLQRLRYLSPRIPDVIMDMTLLCYRLPSSPHSFFTDHYPSVAHRVHMSYTYSCVHYPPPSRRLPVAITTTTDDDKKSTTSGRASDDDNNNNNNNGGYLYVWRRTKAAKQSRPVAEEAEAVISGCRLSLTTGQWSPVASFPTDGAGDACVISLDGIGILHFPYTPANNNNKSGNGNGSGTGSVATSRPRLHAYDSSSDTWTAIHHWSLPIIPSQITYMPYIKIIWMMIDHQMVHIATAMVAAMVVVASH